MPGAEAGPEPSGGPVDCIVEDDRWLEAGIEALANRAVRAALGFLGHEPGGFLVALLAADNARIAALNAEFRGKPVPTDVLSWPAAELAAARPGAIPRAPVAGTVDDPCELGDIALAWETCVQDAAAGGVPLADHLTHLVVHGLLHLLGFDHEDDADAALMERTEAEILAELGIPDPYGHTGPDGPV